MQEKNILFYTWTLALLLCLVIETFFQQIAHIFGLGIISAIFLLISFFLEMPKDKKRGNK